jgi:hypothetical protein
LRDPERAPAYRELRSRATAIEAFGARTVVVGQEDLIAMKLADGEVLVPRTRQLHSGSSIRAVLLSLSV